MQCAWDRSFEIALEKLINLPAIANTTMWNDSTYTHHKTNTILRLPFSPIFCFVPWHRCKNIIKNPLRDIFGHHTCTHLVLERKNKARLLLPLGEKSWATYSSVNGKEKWKMYVLRAVIFLYEKRNFQGFLCMEKGLSVILFTSSDLQLYD